MKAVLATVVTIFVVSDCVLGQAADKPMKDEQISVAPGKYFDYYHISFTLTPENTIKPFGEGKFGPKKYEIGNGQFEVFIQKESFPIKCRCSNKYIIFRAPYLEHPDPEYLRVFDELKTMLESSQGSVEVVLELNPYVDRTSDNPMILELTAPNVFLRTAYGKYINYLGPLKEVDKGSDE
ncbi:MAG: hypothetical protein WA958_07665 [Tunicatimonas sp.]